MKPKLDPAERYIRSIRNSNKRAYARCWTLHCLASKAGSEPPETSFDLSYMAAQAVRQRLAALGIEPSA